MTFASAVLEAIDALLALAYIGLQIYYGVCYHIQVFKFVANILVLLLVYIAITWLQHYPEKLNHIAAELCVGNIRKYSLRLLMFVKLVFTAGLLVPCVCDAFGIAIRDVYSLNIECSLYGTVRHLFLTSYIYYLIAVTIQLFNFFYTKLHFISPILFPQ